MDRSEKKFTAIDCLKCNKTILGVCIKDKNTVVNCGYCWATLVIAGDYDNLPDDLKG